MRLLKKIIILMLISWLLGNKATKDIQHKQYEYENRDTSVPFFAFNVTMQNHGGYTVSSSNFNESIYITSSEKVFPKANRYLSLVKETDNAFKKMVDYFEKVDEPTVICSLLTSSLYS